MEEENLLTWLKRMRNILSLPWQRRMKMCEEQSKLIVVIIWMSLYKLKWNFHPLACLVIISSHFISRTNLKFQFKENEEIIFSIFFYAEEQHNAIPAHFPKVFCFSQQKFNRMRKCNRASNNLLGNLKNEEKYFPNTTMSLSSP